MATHTRAWLAQPASWARGRGWKSRLSRHGSGLHSPAGGEGCSGGHPLHASRSRRAHEDRTARGRGLGGDKERQNKAERGRQRNGMNRWRKNRYESKSYKGWDENGSTRQRCFNLNTLVDLCQGSLLYYAALKKLDVSDPEPSSNTHVFNIWTHLNNSDQMC